MIMKRKKEQKCHYINYYEPKVRNFFHFFGCTQELNHVDCKSKKKKKNNVQIRILSLLLLFFHQ